MQVAVARANTPGKNALTSDGVHMACPGNKMMATGILKGLGLDAEEQFEAKFSLREMQHMEKAAADTDGVAQGDTMDVRPACGALRVHCAGPCDEPEHLSD